MLELTGRFHPLFVHLPIGFLLIAVIFIWLNQSEKVIRISLWLGAIAAVFSVITGLLLESSGDYNESVNTHKWLGITLAAMSVTMGFVPIAKWKAGSVLLTILVFATGHFGGTLTHGPLFGETGENDIDISQVDLNNAVFYADVVQPLLEAKCYSCHGESKQKGKLRLDSPEAIMKGGKNGKVIEPGNSAESELVVRIDLPVDDEDHMPPKEKKQLTDQEKKLISLWVSSGADFSKKVTDLADIKELFTSNESKVTLPDVDVPAPDQELIEGLIEKGVSITPVANDSHFLQVNFISVPNDAGALLESLKPLAKNVVSLKLNKTNIDGVILGDFVNVTTLNLSDTKISDTSIDEIIKCKSLVSLNLSGTRVTNEGVRRLKQCEKLRYLNVYNTAVDKVELPGVDVERGNYNVPTLETDTTVIKI